MNDFDLLKSPLQGTNLIEASAGTGKTFTITGIFLRLVLEQALKVDQILVVTFTRDATAEVRDRIRVALKYLMDEIETSGSTGEEFLRQLAAEYRDRDRRELALGRLAEALRNFDQASISTIHGFCRRMLQENAFESASPFDTELITDQRDLLREVIEDFWRKNFYEVFPEVIQCAQQEIKKPEDLLSLLGNHPSPARLNIVPRISPQLEELEKLILEFRKLFSILRQSWPEAKEQVRELLMNAGLNGSRYGNRIPGFLKEMDNYLKTPEPELPLNFSNIEKFTPGYLASSKTKHGSVPGHSFFDLCEDFTRRVDAVKQTAALHLLYLKTQMFNYLQQELPVRKRRRNVQFYDDLLLGMLDAIQGKTSEALILSLRKKYRAVMIDEFQDTDPIQYAVFSRVFVGGDSNLFLIGDPKQAIYGFRGADIFAYHEAAKQVKKVYTLRLNWRSGTGLVEAVNRIFSRVKQPFAFEWIEFHRAEAAPGGDREELKLDGRSEPPFQLWFMDADNMEAGLLSKNGFIKKSEAREMACRGVAAEISRLVNLGREGRAMLDTEPVKAGDIAVLVRRNVEAEQMQKALAELNIPSLLHERIYLFDTHEALEMERVLAAIAEPNNERLLKVALTTDILGLGGEELSRLLEHERDLEDWLARFGNYFLTWHDHGFIRMFAEFISKENVRVRLLEFADGERRLTNLLHLAEVLHQHSTESRPGVRGLVKWLSEQRDPNSPRPEELKLRLETDEKAVKLVTIHKSKGLEYPIVFCPMAWDQSTIGKKEKTLQFHDREGRFTLDLGSENWEENRRFAQEERLAENLRLLYVSLTRAKSRCYLIWGRINESWTSAPAYLFHSARTGESFAGTDALGEGVKSLGGKQIYQDLEQLAGSAGGCIALSLMPLGPGEPFRPLAEEQEKLECRRFDGRIDQEWRISSFSSLVSGRVQETELPDRDALVSYHEEPGLEQEEPAGILAFPGGIRAGNFFHGLLERLDFSRSDPEKLGSQVAERLKLYGFDLAWENEVCAMLRRLVSLTLGGDGQVFTLSQIGLKNRLNELEFYLPLKSINPEKLKNVFAASDAFPIADRFPERIGRLSFSPAKGFLKGFMDLVFKHGERFYLVDWKSNYLGSRIEDYRPEALVPSMQREFYTLQYHLYTVALDRYLRFRMPGYAYHTHFGGVYYIFLRGVDPDKNPDYGLYYDLPPAGLIEELGKTLISDKVNT